MCHVSNVFLFLSYHHTTYIINALTENTVIAYAKGVPRFPIKHALHLISAILVFIVILGTVYHLVR